MTAFALYRLPNESHCTLLEQTHGEPCELLSCADLNGREGFVFAPFAANAAHPILLLRADRVRRMDVRPQEWRRGAAVCEKAVAGERESYAGDFAKFHAQLQCGGLDKVVLSRRSRMSCSGKVSAEELFWRACHLYPRLFVALVHTSRGGTWLMATPEVLLGGNGGEWTTMALAGTMAAGGDIASVEWSDKNRAEQQYVASYIGERLEGFASDVRTDGPYTTTAARLFHLRTDFMFTLRDSGRVGDLLDVLHPTPAVCGVPKAEARRFILHEESVDRRYYSGFCGPLFPQADTHLFVSLRCMEIHNGSCDLYAGGGILPGSDAESEWAETEAKLETMRNLF